MKTTSDVPQPSSDLLKRAGAVRSAANLLGQTTNKQRYLALMSMADALSSNSKKIANANQKDLAQSESEGLASALMSRLKLNEEKLEAAIDGVRKGALLPDPLGRCELRRELDEKLIYLNDRFNLKKEK